MLETRSPQLLLWATLDSTTQKLVHRDTSDRHPEKDVQMFEAVSSLFSQRYRPDSQPVPLTLPNSQRYITHARALTLEVSYIHASLQRPNQNAAAREASTSGRIQH